MDEVQKTIVAVIFLYAEVNNKKLIKTKEIYFPLLTHKTASHR